MKFLVLSAKPLRQARYSVLHVLYLVLVPLFPFWEVQHVLPIRRIWLVFMKINEVESQFGGRKKG